MPREIAKIRRIEKLPFENEAENYCTLLGVLRTVLQFVSLRIRSEYRAWCPLTKMSKKLKLQPFLRHHVVAAKMKLRQHRQGRAPPFKDMRRGLGVSGLARGERLQIMLTREELRALDDWRFKRRMPSRAAAVRELLKRGLAAEGFSIADEDVKSRDFGLLGNQGLDGESSAGED